jgi:hypothetical protein
MHPTTHHRSAVPATPAARRRAESVLVVDEDDESALGIPIFQWRCEYVTAVRRQRVVLAPGQGQAGRAAAARAASPRRDAHGRCRSRAGSSMASAAATYVYVRCVGAAE